MKGKYKDIVRGHMIGKCVFIEFVPKKTRLTRGLLKCPCGNEFEADLRGVERENLGCGCRHGGVVKHGHSTREGTSKEYNSWKAAKRRCYTKSNKRYKDYGGRGIKMCSRWLNSFSNFLEDMGNRPTKYHTLDRIDVNGDYEPSNCRWITRQEQNMNTTRNVRFEHNGETLTLIEWSRKTGIHRNTIQQRYHKGYSPENILRAV